MVEMETAIFVQIIILLLWLFPIWVVKAICAFVMLISLISVCFFYYQFFIWVSYSISLGLEQTSNVLL